VPASGVRVVSNKSSRGVTQAPADKNVLLFGLVFGIKKGKKDLDSSSSFVRVTRRQSGLYLLEEQEPKRKQPACWAYYNTSL